MPGWPAGSRTLNFVEGSTPAIDQTRDWLRKYLFAGESADTGDLQLEMRGAPFELRVWTALRKIPVGTTTTYGAIARGNCAPCHGHGLRMANGANPIAIILPCHRVIGANGTLTGYGGGCSTKSWLLGHERKLGARTCAV